MQPAPDLFARANRQPGASLQRYAFNRDKREYIGGSDARVLPLVLRQVDERRRALHRAKCGFRHRLRRARKGQNRAVVVAVRVPVEQQNAGDLPHGGGYRIDLGGVPPFGKIGDALDQRRHGIFQFSAPARETIVRLSLRQPGTKRGPSAYEILRWPHEERKFCFPSSGDWPRRLRRRGEHRSREHDVVSIARDNSEYLRVNLSMGAGDLRVSPGSSKFAEGLLTYNVESWKPVVNYTATAGHGSLDISQPVAHHTHSGSVKYSWELRLAEDVPMDMTVHFGAGDAKLDLGRLFLRSVDVEMGVGELDMDLRGPVRRDYDVRVRGGVGQATIRLPHDAGVYAKAQGGIGEVHSTGLRREGDHLVNDAYDHSKTSIHLDIQGGVGQINLLAD